MVMCHHTQPFIILNVKWPPPACSCLLLFACKHRFAALLLCSPALQAKAALFGGWQMASDDARGKRVLNPCRG